MILQIDHFKQPETSALLDSARIVYSAGFFMTVSPDTMLHAADHAKTHNKVFCMVRPKLNSQGYVFVL